MISIGFLMKNRMHKTTLVGNLVYLEREAYSEHWYL